MNATDALGIIDNYMSEIESGYVDGVLHGPVDRDDCLVCCVIRKVKLIIQDVTATNLREHSDRKS